MLSQKSQFWSNLKHNIIWDFFKAKCAWKEVFINSVRFSVGMLDPIPQFLVMLTILWAGFLNVKQRFFKISIKCPNLEPKYKEDLIIYHIAHKHACSNFVSLCCKLDHPYCHNVHARYTNANACIHLNVWKSDMKIF